VTPELRPTAATSSGPSVARTVSGAAPATTPAGAHSPSSAEYIASGIKQHRLASAIALLVLLVAAFGVGAYLHARNTEVAIESIAVLPFVDQNHDPDSEYLSDGLTEGIINSLTQLPRLKVIARSSVFRYKGKETDPFMAGKELGVRAILTGRIVQRGGNVTISTELVDVRDNKQLWGEQYERKASELMSLQRDIASQIANNLRLTISGEAHNRMAKHYTDNPEAYQLYLKGRYYWNKQTFPGLTTAISYFNQAIAKDPGYALAYSGLADAHLVLTSNGGTPSDYPKSNAAARKALELDATLARPHAALGASEMEYDWDFAGGEAEYKKAFELDPNDAMVRDYYAWDISMIGGREQEALAEINRGHQLDPLSPVISTDVGYVHIRARRYDEAIAVCKKLADENPTFAKTRKDCLALAYWGKRMYPQVIEEYKAYGQISGDRNESDFASALELGFRSAGWKGALTKGIEIRQAQRKTGYSSACRIAELYADLGDKDQAFRWLNTAYQERDWCLVGLKTDFVLDPLRSDPRFAELVRKVGLPQR